MTTGDQSVRAVSSWPLGSGSGLDLPSGLAHNVYGKSVVHIPVETRCIHGSSPVATVTALHVRDLWFISVWWLRIRSQAALAYVHALVGLLCVLGNSLNFHVLHLGK